MGGGKTNALGKMWKRRWLRWMLLPWSIIATYLVVIWALPRMVDEKKLRQRLQDWGMQRLYSTTDVSIHRLRVSLNLLARAKLKMHDLVIESSNPEFELPFFIADPAVVTCPLWGLGGVASRPNLQLRGMKCRLMFDEAGRSNLDGFLDPQFAPRVLPEFPAGVLNFDSIGVQVDRGQFIFSAVGLENDFSAEATLGGAVLFDRKTVALSGKLHMPEVKALGISAGNFDFDSRYCFAPTGENEKIGGPFFAMRLDKPVSGKHPADSGSLLKVRAFASGGGSKPKMEIGLSYLDLSGVTLNAEGQAVLPALRVILSKVARLDFNVDTVDLFGLPLTNLGFGMAPGKDGDKADIFLDTSFAKGSLSLKAPGWVLGEKKLPPGSRLEWKGANAAGILPLAMPLIPEVLRCSIKEGLFDLRLSRFSLEKPGADAGVSPQWRAELLLKHWAIPRAGMNLVFREIAFIPSALSEVENLRRKSLSMQPLKLSPKPLKELVLNDFKVVYEVFGDGQRRINVSGDCPGLGRLTGGGIRNKDGAYRIALALREVPVLLLDRNKNLSQEMQRIIRKQIDSASGLQLDLDIGGGEKQVVRRYIQDIFRRWTEEKAKEAAAAARKKSEEPSASQEKPVQVVKPVAGAGADTGEAK